MGAKDEHTKSANIAVNRLSQLNAQVGPASTVKKSKKNRGSELPADWSDVLGELDLVRKFAQTPKYDTTGYIRHKEGGKLWVRERIELLLDPGTFAEVGSAAGTATWSKPDGPKHSIIEEEKEVVRDFTPSNNVQGAYSAGLFSCTVWLRFRFRVWENTWSPGPIHCRRFHFAGWSCRWRPHVKDTLYGEALCAFETSHD
jgi:hypothetical protein